MTTSFTGRAMGLCVTGCLLGTVLFASAAPTFRADKNYPALGLYMRGLANSEPEPLAQCTQYTYTVTRGGESLKRNLFDPRELWYASQHAGQWRDPHDNVLILGRPTHLLPVFRDKHVSQEDFDKALLDPANAFAPASSAALTAWIKAFANGTPLIPEPLRIQSFTLAHAVYFPLKETTLLAYAFRVKIRQPSGEMGPSDWICAVIKIADGTPKAKVRAAFETQLLAHVAAMRQTDAGSATSIQSTPLTLDQGRGTLSAPAIDEHPSRIAARKSIANMKGWWYAETPEYIILSDIRSAGGRKLVRDLQSDMPVLRNAFAALIPPFTSMTDVSVVRIYEEAEAYKQYVGSDMEWSAGVWAPMRRELVIQAQGNDKDQTMTILKHEGFHQYLFYACDMIENAVWFNEGHACLFEGAKIVGRGRVDIPENARVASLLRNLAAVARLIPTLIHSDHADFYNGSDEDRALKYTAAWALVYFLRKGQCSERYAAYAPILDRYLEVLASTRNADKATAAAFAGVSMETLETDFIRFWQRDRSAASRFNLLDKKNLRSDQRVRAGLQ